MRIYLLLILLLAAVASAEIPIVENMEAQGCADGAPIGFDMLEGADQGLCVGSFVTVKALPCPGYSFNNVSNIEVTFSMGDKTTAKKCTVNGDSQYPLIQLTNGQNVGKLCGVESPTTVGAYPVKYSYTDLHGQAREGDAPFGNIQISQQCSTTARCTHTWKITSVPVVELDYKANQRVVTVPNEASYYKPTDFSKTHDYDQSTGEVVIYANTMVSTKKPIQAVTSQCSNGVIRNQMANIYLYVNEAGKTKFPLGLPGETRQLPLHNEASPGGDLARQLQDPPHLHNSQGAGMLKSGSYTGTQDSVNNIYNFLYSGKYRVWTDYINAWCDSPNYICPTPGNDRCRIGQHSNTDMTGFTSAGTPTTLRVARPQIEILTESLTILYEADQFVKLTIDVENTGDEKVKIRPINISCSEIGCYPDAFDDNGKEIAPGQVGKLSYWMQIPKLSDYPFNMVSTPIVLDFQLPLTFGVETKYGDLPPYNISWASATARFVDQDYLPNYCTSPGLSYNTTQLGEVVWIGRNKCCGDDEHEYFNAPAENESMSYVCTPTDIGEQSISYDCNGRQCPAPPVTPTHWWKAENNADSSGSMQATLNNDATYSEGLEGSAFSFDGQDDYIQMPDMQDLNFGTQDFTIEWMGYTPSSRTERNNWFRIGFAHTSGSYPSCAGSHAGLQFYSSPTEVLLYTSATSGGTSSCMSPVCRATGISIPTNAWNHFAIVKSNGQIKVYVNGDQKCSVSSNNCDMAGRKSPLMLGKQYTGNIPGTCSPGNSAGSLQGKIDNFRIYKGTGLTQDQIQTIAECRNVPECSIDSATGMATAYSEASTIEGLECEWVPDPDAPADPANGACWDSTFVNNAETTNEAKVLASDAFLHSCNAATLEPGLLEIKDALTEEQLLTDHNSCEWMSNIDNVSTFNFYCDVDGKWKADDETNDLVIKTHHTNESNQLCCKPDSCLGDNGCVSNQVNASTDVLEANKFRCVNGEWKLENPKTNFDRRATGYCPTREQCLVYPGGDAEKNNMPDKFFNVHEEDWPACIGDGQYFLDYYCEQGNWTSRTKILALHLMEIAKSFGTDYEIFCDNYNNTLNNYAYGLPDGFSVSTAFVDRCIIGALNDQPCINQMCALKFSEGIAMAVSLNQDVAQPSKGFLKALGKNTNVCDLAKDTKDNRFTQCDLTTYYNADLNSVIVLPKELAIPTPTTPEVIAARNGEVINRFRELRSFVESDDKLSPSSSVFMKTNLFDKLFILNKGTRDWFAFYELGRYSNATEYGANVDYIGMNFKEFNLPGACSNITASIVAEYQDFPRNCVQSGDRLKFVQYYRTGEGNMEGLWKDLTAKLRP